MALEIDLVTVPAGVLHRGTPAQALDALVDAHADVDIPYAWFLKETPRAVVEVPAFRIARTPVTIGQWAAFAAATGRPVLEGQPDHPVDELSWGEAALFATWAAERLGIALRLPTETEWERAARGDDTREYPWGDRFDPALANTREHGAGSTIPVGSLPAGASPFGVLDLAGNVDEWTATEYAPYPGAEPGVPRLEEWASDDHVTRGGSFRHARDLARCARRHGVYPPAIGAGFRLAADLPQTGTANAPAHRRPPAPKLTP